MKYELGDRVKIKKHWKREPLPYNLDEMLEEQRDEIAGAGIKFDKYLKAQCNEEGFICGTRSLKTSTTLSYEHHDAIDVGVGMIPEKEGVEQMDSEHVKVYLVATRMNCLRKVSKEDLEFISEWGK
ncbi:hypothetical protein [Listeria booriae]|uniref:Uncharacterized protein n=1 Tax=Listeria booriae TaxID=1552123 RepID=A0A7X0YKX6_9LIST|nr:hypothetical protein [Listeria booriae]MBC2115713.1 hypothetical protein [Listeria booriae]